MYMKLVPWVSGTIGVASVTGGAYYLWQCRSDSFSTRTRASRGSHAALQISANNLTSEIVDGVLTDKETLDNITTLIQNAFLADKTAVTLKELFVEQFTENEETLASLRQFIVGNVIQDAWVSERLIGLSKDLGQYIANDEVIWNNVLQFLHETSVQALQKDEFYIALDEGISQAVKIAIGKDPSHVPVSLDSKEVEK